MVPNKLSTSLRDNKRTQIATFISALALILAIAYIGTMISGLSSAGKPVPVTTPVANSMVLDPSSGRLTPGTDLAMAILENSGTDGVNVVQAKLDYDPAISAVRKYH